MRLKNVKKFLNLCCIKANEVCGIWSHVNNNAQE